jgi:mRNA interferase RelE/StbE
MNKQKWELVFTSDADKKFQKLDRPIQKQVQKYIQKILTSGEPRDFGKPLKSNLAGFWCYRVGDYRLICVIEDHQLLMTVIELNHRKNVYDIH